MFHRVLMRVVQPGEIGLLIRELGFPEVVPDLSARRLVEPVDPDSGLRVEFAEHSRKARRVRFGPRRLRDEVVVIGEHGPRFEIPIEIARHREQAAMKNGEPFAAAKMMLFEISASGDEVGRTLRKLVGGCVRPGGFGRRHDGRMTSSDMGSQCKIESAAETRQRRGVRWLVGNRADTAFARERMFEVRFEVRCFPHSECGVCPVCARCVPSPVPSPRPPHELGARPTGPQGVGTVPRASWPSASDMSSLLRPGWPRSGSWGHCAISNRNVLPPHPPHSETSRTCL